MFFWIKLLACGVEGGRESCKRQAWVGEEKQKTRKRGGGTRKQYNNTRKGPVGWLQMEDANPSLPVRSLAKRRSTADARGGQGIDKGRSGTPLRQQTTVFFNPSHSLYGEQGEHGDPTYLEVFKDEIVISTELDSAVKFPPVPEGSLNVSCARNLNCFSSSLWKSFIGIGTQNLSFQSTRVGS